MDVYLVSRLPRARVDAFVEQVQAHGSSFLGRQYTTTVRMIAGGPIATVVTIARNTHSPLPEYLYEDDSTISVFSGYLVDKVGSARTVRGWFGPAGRDERPVLRSPGGIYSYVTIRRTDGQICAGHSTPTLEPVYWSEAADALHVGNHPLLVHVAGHGFARPDIDQSFYLSAVNAAAAIDNTTPYTGCYRLPPRSLLVNQPGTYGARVVAAPRPAYGRHPVSTLRQRIDAVAESLARAGSVVTTLPQGEIRVSGGKDSRLLAAWLAHAGIAATPVNNNFAVEAEGQIADQVAARLGWESSVRIPREKIPLGDEIHRLTRHKIAYAGGLPAVAALQYTIQSEGTTPGAPLIMGHAHLQRGGLYNRVRSLPEAMVMGTSRTVSRYLRPEYAEKNTRIVRDYVNTTMARPEVTPQSMSFHGYLQFTANYQLQSLYAYVRNFNPLITPLVDERFALLCEDIALSPAPRLRKGEYTGIADLRDDRIGMGVTHKLTPSLLEFPLFGDRYRCDGPHWAGFAQRDPETVQGGTVSPEDMKMVFNTRRTRPHVRAQLWEQIEGTAVRTWAETTCRPEIYRYLSEPGSDVPEGVHQVSLNQFLWSVYGLSQILGTDWWSELTAPPRS